MLIFEPKISGRVQALKMPFVNHPVVSTKIMPKQRLKSLERLIREGFASDEAWIGARVAFQNLVRANGDAMGRPDSSRRQ